MTLPRPFRQAVASAREHPTTGFLVNQAKYVTTHGSVLTVAVALSNLLALLVIYVYNQLGEVGSYGFYKYIMSVLPLVGMTSITGMHAAILISAAQNKPHILRTASRRRIQYSLLAGCPILLATALIMIRWFPEHRLAGYACLILLPLFPFMYSFTGVYSYLTGLRQYRLLSLVQITWALINLIAVWVCLRFWPQQPLLPPVTVLVLKTAFEYGLYQFLVRRDRVPLLHNDAHLLTYGMKATLAGVTGNVESHLDGFIVGTVFGFQNLGMFGAGRAVVLPLRQLAYTYYQLYTPKLARKSPAEALRLTRRALAWGCLILLPVYAVVFWLLPWGYATFLQKFDQSGAYARWFVLMVICAVPYFFYGPFFQSQRQARREVLVRVGRTAAIALGLLVFVYYFGIMGVIYAEILGTASMSLHGWWEARKSRAIPSPAPAAATSDAAALPPSSPEPGDSLGPDAG